MFDLLKLYFVAIDEVLRAVLKLTIGYCVFSGCLFLLPFISWVWSCYIVASFLPALLALFGAEKSLYSSLRIIFFIIAVSCMPALTLNYMLLAFAVDSFLSGIFIFDRMVGQKLGEVFAIKKLLRNPLGHLEVLRPILEKSPISYQLYLNLLNDAAPGSAKYCDSSVDLAAEEIDAMIAWQTQLIEEMPAELKALDSRAVNSENVTNRYTLYQDYRSSLTATQQAAFDSYRDTFLSLIDATCSITRDLVSAENQDDFSILEKCYRVAGNRWCAVPGGTSVFSKEFDGRDIFFTFAHYHKDQHAPTQSKFILQHPNNRDSILHPSAYHSSEGSHDTEKETHYRRYPYQIIEGHPLSLEFCEKLHNFNASLGLTVRPISASASATSAPISLKVSPNSLFPQQSSLPTATKLENTLTPI